MNTTFAGGALPPLSLYVHYPWCVRKCPYCDFNSHTRREGEAEDVLEARYIDALTADLEHARDAVAGRAVTSIFFGGGTPSLMSAAGMERVLRAIDARLALAHDVEITLEANPGTFETARFAAYRAAGVNRLSIGIQSFSDTHLARIGRIHDSAEARRAVDIALEHFERVNLDLMYALPEQNLEQALADLEIAVASGVGHLSCYHLTLEPNTLFHRQPPPLPDEDLAADMQEAIEARLAAAGFSHYETSAFARLGQPCRHNLNYWQFGDYLGVGAGAHAKLSGPEGVVREMRHKHPQRYLEAAMQGDFVQERRCVTSAELPFEFMMNALRLTDGVPAALYEPRTGVPLENIASTLTEARAEGLLDSDPALLRPTLKGQRFLNELLGRFL